MCVPQGFLGFVGGRFGGLQSVVRYAFGDFFAAARFTTFLGGLDLPPLSLAIV